MWAGEAHWMVTEGRGKDFLVVQLAKTSALPMQGPGV